MCGIVGILDRTGRRAPDADVLARMNARIEHRGPDEEGSWIGGPAGLAMRRLSIIDLSTGQQPIANEDGTIRIVFNGEIYNYQALREELIAKGHSFRTRSDTETIVHLYEELGVDCVQRLRGMFALALWDEPRGRLLLARDRLGKKPLVYAEAGGMLAWSSEIRSLLQFPGIPRDLDPVALDMYLGLQYVPSPRTIFRAVRKLPPGHRMVVEGGDLRIEKYWELPLHEPELTLGVPEAEHAVRAAVTEATRLRMISEVPLGAFLSGGIDSSVVVATMASLSSRPVRTFSIGFDEEEHSELPHAREVAQRFGTQHEEFVVRPDMASVLEPLAAQYGEPYADPSALPTWYLAQMTRRHVTVALNGDGGDEGFAGYRRYAAMKLGDTWSFLPKGALSLGAGALEQLARVGARRIASRGARALRALAIPTEAERYQRLVGCIPPADREALYSPAFRAALGDHARADLAYLGAIFARGAHLDVVRRLQLVDAESYLPECLMTKVDIATMAHSLEARSPLLDHELLALAFRLPASMKLRGTHGTKWILKRAFRDVLPESILNRGKMGFGIPIHEWFRGPLRARWEDTVLSGDALARGAFKEDALRRMLVEHSTGARDHGYRMWALLMLELWFRSSLPEGRLA